MKICTFHLRKHFIDSNVVPQMFLHLFALFHSGPKIDPLGIPNKISAEELYENLF